MRGGQWLALALPPLLLAGLAASAAQRIYKTASLENVSTTTPCQSPPVYRVGYAREANGIVPTSEGFRFQGNAYLETQLCRAGQLSFTTTGEPADGEDPRLTIFLDGKLLEDMAVGKQRRQTQVDIPHGGRLLLAYFNDYYLADVRVATLEKVSFSGAGCVNFTVDVPIETGGDWVEQSKTATLVAKVPMTLVPCQAGKLSFQVIGRKGDGAFPVLKVEQAGQVLAALTTSDTRQRVALNVQRAPVHITLTNPYGKTLADRNFSLEGLSFTPAPSKQP